MSIRLNKNYKEKAKATDHIQYGSKEDVPFSHLFRFFHQAFPQAFDRGTFQRVFDASDVSRTAYCFHCCCRIKIYGALLATSTFDSDQNRQLKILMLVEEERSSSSLNIGKRLLSQLIETSKELENIQLIYAYVELTNVDGIQFYKTMGFQQREILHDYFPMRTSLTPDAIKLEFRIRRSSQEHFSSALLSPISMMKFTVI